MENSTVLALLARHGATALAGYFVTSGTINASQKDQAIGAFVFIASLVWSWWQKQGQQQTLAAIAKAQGLIHKDATTADAATVAKAVAKTAAVLLLAALLFSPSASFAGILDNPAGSPGGVKKIGAVIQSVKQFTVDDLTAAAADADAQTPPDPAGECWRTLIPVVQSQTSPLPQSLGLAQAIQKARDLQHRVRAGVSDDIKSKCAIVLWDAESALLKFGVRIAPIPGLSALPLP